jgi:hypothetical protein
VDSWAEVRVYKLGTPVAELIHALTTPGDKTDELLREVAQGSAKEVLDEIRALVC